MKVLMTADAVGGVWTYALELCRALGALDVQVVLATLGPLPTSAQCDAAAKLTNVRLTSAAWKLEWMERPWEDVAGSGSWLRELADRERVDLVHLNGYAHAALAWQRPVLVVAHSCVCSWWQSVYGESAPPDWNQYRDAVAAGLAAADHVVAPTRAFLQMLEAEYGTLRRASVIHNARDSSSLQGEDARAPTIFACGRIWDRAKNLQTLDVACASLPWKTYVAGDATSPDGRRCEPLRLECLGRLPEAEVGEWMGRAAIFAHPALYEPFGLAVLEAAARGCALVLSDLPTLRELWDGAALFASAREPDAFRAQLKRLIERPDERVALAQAARVRALAQFKPDAMASAYHALYVDLIRTHSKERAVA